MNCPRCRYLWRLTSMNLDSVVLLYVLELFMTHRCGAAA